MARPQFQQDHMPMEILKKIRFSVKLRLSKIQTLMDSNNYLRNPTASPLNIPFQGHVRPHWLDFDQHPNIHLNQLAL